MKKRNFYVLILVLILTVGYASISTTLVLNGVLGLGESGDFKIIFANSIVNGASKKESINENEDTIVFSLENLVTTDDVNTLDYEVANMSQNYDAEVSVSCSTNNTDVVFLYQPESIALTAGNSQKGRVEVRVTANQDIAKNDDVTCTMDVKKVSRNELGKEYVKPYTDKVLNGADPVLDENNKLVPITLANDGTVTYADIKQEWYNYENKEWANAVILVDSPSKSYKVGETILESDIESYFVWIPRYRYQIFDEGNYTEFLKEKPTTESIAKEIKIKFESNSATPANGSTKDSWLTHPAFTNFNVNGLWVGKFETGYAEASSQVYAQVNEVKSDKVVIKPNVYSWRGITVSNIFKTAYDYERDLDSHMIKNTEWGAVAYLSHSKYGINTEVRINNNSNYLTGYAGFEKDAAASATGTKKTFPYNTETGYLASTTGNITGIYDMSGGVYEYVAGYAEGVQENGGFTAEELSIYSKYFDIYVDPSAYWDFSNRILGDATGEMGPFYYYADSGTYNYHNNWYNDYTFFVHAEKGNKPWFLRGEYYNSGFFAGQFAFSSAIGDSSSSYGSRLVLAV